MISVVMSSNEMPRDDDDPRAKRASAFWSAVMDDSRFEGKGYANIPVDLQFTGMQSEYVRAKSSHGRVDYDRASTQACFNVELKEPSDYIQSALGPSGHLYQQVLTIRELGHPCMVLVLGSDEDITNAIKDATKTRYKGQERAYQIGSYNDRLLDFEANSEALGCRVARWKASPWKRLLSTVHKVLTGGNLLSYRPKPVNGERELAASCLLFGQGIGPAILKPVLDEYKLALIPRGSFARQPCDMPGIGKKRAAIIDQRVKMVYGV